MIAWVGIENAIHAAVAAGSGLAGSSVTWAHQGGKVPAGSWISMAFRRLSIIGRDFMAHDVPAGPSIDPIFHLCGHRLLTLQITHYNGAATGVSMPVAVLDGVITHASRTDVLDTLGAAGIGTLSFSPVLQIDGLPNVAEFEPRAIVDMTFIVPSDVTIPMTTIRSVELTGESPDVRTDMINSL